MSIKNKVLKTVSMTVLKTKKASPEILLGVGIAGVVVSGALLVRASMRVAPHMEGVKHNYKKLATDFKAHEEGDISREDYVHAMAKYGVRPTLNIIKEFALPVGVGAVSVGCILWSHNIISKRLLTTTAAYTALSEGFAKYRERVGELLSETDIDPKSFDAKAMGTVLDENEEKHRRVPGEMVSIYAQWFDENNPNFERDNQHNLFFLKSQQTYWNDRLQARGHVFLNEVYESLGFEHTRAGAITGWVLENGDSYIDFGIYDGDVQVNKDFLAGFESQLLLDFNVDGVIYDLI